MPLLKRARIEIYLPDGNKPSFRRLQQAAEQEFLYTFGGCTVIKNTKGLYLNRDRKPDADGINLVYADAPFDFDKHFKALSLYTDQLREAVLEASGKNRCLFWFTRSITRFDENYESTLLCAKCVIWSLWLVGSFEIR